MTAERIGFWGGLAVFASMLALPAPVGMEPSAWHVAALTILMATWWMTQALPLTVTALLPFLALPLMNIMTAQDVAKEYYSPILFLILGGAFLALTIERTGMHRRVAFAILAKSGHSVTGLMIAFMGSTALLSMVMSNTSIALIMVPMALAVIAEASLSYLGVGMPATQPSLGTLIRIGQEFLFSGEWWITIFPGAALVLLVLSVNLLGDWLRDALNPRLR